MPPPPPRSLLFPYTTLFRSTSGIVLGLGDEISRDDIRPSSFIGKDENFTWPEEAVDADGASEDRKSTRLNSSHLVISYAVFCLKKKRSDQPRARKPYSHLSS